MVKWIIALTFCGSSTFADTVIRGRAMGTVSTRKDSGRFDASFARVEELEIRESKYRDLLAYELRATRFRWILSMAERADFSRATLADSVWQGGSLYGGRFREANLRNAVFAGVEFQSCVMDGADLRGARFENSMLYNCSFWRATFNDQTLLPFDAATAASLGMIYAP